MRRPDLNIMMLRIFGAAEWREVFRRCKGCRADFWRWLYNQYIASNAWRLKRAKRLEFDGRHCRSGLCFRVDELEVHHKTYERIGDEDVEKDLVTLCRRCHAAEHSDEITKENHPLFACVRS